MPNNLLFIIHNLNNTVVHKNRSELKSNHSNRNTFDFFEVYSSSLISGEGEEGCNFFRAFHIIRLLFYLIKYVVSSFPYHQIMGTVTGYETCEDGMCYSTILCGWRFEFSPHSPP